MKIGKSRSGQMRVLLAKDELIEATVIKPDFNCRDAWLKLHIVPDDRVEEDLVCSILYNKQGQRYFNIPQILTMNIPCFAVQPVKFRQDKFYTNDFYVETPNFEKTPMQRASRSSPKSDWINELKAAIELVNKITNEHDVSLSIEQGQLRAKVKTTFTF